MLIVPPGWTVEDMVNDNSWTNEFAAKALGISLEDYVSLKLGKLKIDYTLASKLSDRLGCSKRFWLQREANYRESLSKAGFWDPQIYKAQLEETFNYIIQYQVELLKTARYDDLVLQLILNSHPEDYSASALLIMATAFLVEEPFFEKEMQVFLLKIPIQELSSKELNLYKSLIQKLEDLK